MKRSIQKLEQRLHLTPWATTTTFLSASQGKCLLELSGFGDTSGAGEFFSFVKQTQAVSQQKQKKAKVVQKAAVTGTDADLRKLSLDNARLVLLKFGVSEERIRNMTRWE